MSTMAHHAKEVAAELATHTLTPRDWEAFLSALEDTDRPRPLLEAAVHRYRGRRERDVAPKPERG
jgi:uncharacterized protein (DUF1778 family)